MGSNKRSGRSAAKGKGRLSLRTMKRRVTMSNCGRKRARDDDEEKERRTKAAMRRRSDTSSSDNVESDEDRRQRNFELTITISFDGSSDINASISLRHPATMMTTRTRRSVRLRLLVGVTVRRLPILQRSRPLACMPCYQWVGI
ncbi:hypothetical protein BDZ89DRAFT_466402 [Hymenopellis radicata]|nr:hypothetical protein BDZ89DRAFT_466402 [Hymenopellis radicata]